MANIPQHISDAIKGKATSLGDNPAFPPSVNGRDFVASIVGQAYSNIVSKAQTDNLESDLAAAIQECLKLERNIRPALEQLCSNTVTSLFKIPDDTIDIQAFLTDTINKENQRMYPEDEEDFSFEDLDDMQHLEKEIYKRRFLNALVEGASEWYAFNIDNYIQGLWKINPDVPALYNKIINLSNRLMYDADETELQKMSEADGTVNVILNTPPNRLTIRSYGIIFPILLQQTIKGILEAAILQGLPKDKDKAWFVMKKADFRLADVWDSRLGLPLWQHIVATAEKSGADIAKTGVNFFLMELSALSTDDFNSTMREMLAGTKSGAKAISDICKDIEYRQEEDSFNDYVNQQNSAYPIMDGYFTADELLVDDPEIMMFEGPLNELSKDTYEKAAQTAYDRSTNGYEEPDDRVKKFRQAAVDAHRGDHPNYRYSVDRSNTEKKQGEYVQANSRGKVTIFDPDYSSLQDLYNGVKQGRLLIHCRQVDPDQIPNILYPEAGETVQDAYGVEYGENEMPELLFASENFIWAKNYPGNHSSYSDRRNGVFFVDASNFLRSVGDGYVQTPDGQIYLDNEIPLTVETDDWYTDEPADVVGVLVLD